MLHFIGDEIPAATGLWIGGHTAKDVVAEPVSPRMTFLENFEAMTAHLTGMQEAG